MSDYPRTYHNINYMDGQEKLPRISHRYWLETCVQLNKNMTIEISGDVHRTKKEAMADKVLHETMIRQALKGWTP